MELIDFGRTGMTISRLGLGAWAIGGGDTTFGWGDQSDDESIATIHQAVESGVNWIDTAAFYGSGHSEEVVGRAIAALPEEDRPYVFTKGGLPFVDGKSQRVTSPESLRGEVDESLRRLQVERIDLYQVHWPGKDGTALSDTWAAMLALVDEGKARAVGLSNHSVAQLDESAQAGPVAAVQPPLSLVNRQAAADVIPWAHAHGAGVIVYSPMASGLLSGAFTAERAATLPANDWRKNDFEFRGERLRRNLALADALRPVAERHETTPGAVAIAWTLGWPGVHGAIVGARRPEQLAGWIGAADVKLTDADIDEIAAAVAATGAGKGPARP